MPVKSKKSPSPSLYDMRQYGIDDLTAHIEKIKKNIKIFEEAIRKEKDKIKKTEQMIESLKEDQKELSE